MGVSHLLRGVVWSWSSLVLIFSMSSCLFDLLWSFQGSYIYLFVYFLCMCQRQRTTPWSPFSPTIWILGIKLMPPGLAVRVFTCLAILSAPQKPIFFVHSPCHLASPFANPMKINRWAFLTSTYFSASMGWIIISLYNFSRNCYLMLPVSLRHNELYRALKLYKYMCIYLYIIYY